MTGTHPYIVGLTGGIGSGKSAAADYFAGLGVTVIDADQVARDVVAPGTEALAAIVRKFGSALLTAGGELDRAELRVRVFASDVDRQWLEELLHPLIRHELQRQAQAAEGSYVVLAIPLLLENQGYDFIDRTLVVDAPEALQVARASERDGTTAAEIEAIMATQISRGERLLLADDIIDNSTTLDALEEQVNQLHEYYRRQAAAYQES